MLRGRFRLFFQGSGTTLCGVKKVSKAILILFALLVLLAVIALLGINLYIQSPATQARIQDELSKALGIPLKITNTSLTPWSDLRIHGITVPAEHGNFLEAESFLARYRFFPLFGKRLEITEITVENPKIHWVQNAEGKWNLPLLVKAPAKVAAENEKPKSPEKPSSKFEVTVGRFLIKNGAVELLDKENRPVGTFTNVNMNYDVLTAENIAGTLEIEHATWEDSIVLDNVRTPFSYIPGPKGEWTLSELAAEMAGGKVHGRFAAWPEAPKAPFDVALSFESVSIDKLATLEGWKPGQASGRLSGEIELAGESDQIERAEGPGKLRLEGGQLRQLELLQTIGQILEIRELSDFHLKDAYADFHVSGERVHVDQLVLAAPDLQLSAKGTIKFDQRVSLDAQLSVEEAIVKRLPQPVGEGFATADNGRRTIDFEIRGTTSKLKTNLMNKLIVDKVDKQLGGLLENLFRRKDDDRKKKDEEKEKRKKEKEKEKQKNATPEPTVPTAPSTPAPPPAPAPVTAPLPSAPSTPAPTPVNNETPKS